MTKSSLTACLVALVVLAAGVSCLLAAGASSHEANSSDVTVLRGTVESNGTGLSGYNVSLYASFVKPLGHTAVLGSAVTNSSGEFEIDYHFPPGLQAVLFVRAESGSVMLASAIGDAPVSGPVVINERTTVATGFAFAQFVDGTKITGNKYGMLNAVHMAANMADPTTGAMGAVLSKPPNGSFTEALATFNSLANMIANCVKTPTGCQDLLADASVPGGPPADNVLQAVANIAKYPWSNVSALFGLSTINPVYTPALASAPDAWTLFLKFTGGFYVKQDSTNLMNGPGTFAIDKKGNLWVNDNYVPAKPLDIACDGKRLLKFYPWGENFPGSPYFGGGLSGSGWGLSIAPDNRIWVGNFGFAGTGCPTPPANSVSVFRPNGTPIRSDPYTAGPISWPMATVSAPNGNVWIADCGSDSVTVYPKGNPNRAFAVPFPNGSSGDGPPVQKPFGIAFDRSGDAWVTATLGSTVAVYGPEGDLIQSIPSVNNLGHTQLTHPVGIASDIQGNIWVSNSDWLDPPCPPGPPSLGSGANPSVAFFIAHSHQLYPGAPFTGGGITLPWGIAIDGNDTVWVANFGFPFKFSDPSTIVWPAPNRVSQFCGEEPSKCPPTKQGVGVPISPDGTGYESESLDRNTGIAIDPSGNVWLANNWKQIPLLNNPGQNSIVVLVGAAGPVKTPLIGTPQPFVQ